VAVIDFQAAPPSAAACRLAFFGIFDGHGGSNVARYAAEHLHAAVLAAGLQQEAERLAAASAAASAAAAGNGEAPSLPSAQLKQCKAAVAEGFRELDRRVLEHCASAGWQDGCTAVAAWVVGNAVLVANVGDARCVLARRRQPAAAADTAQQQQQQQPGAAGEGGTVASPPAAGQQQEGQPAQQHGQGEGAPEPPPLKAITLTREHKAIFPLERQRIEKAGSFVSGDGRLAGGWPEAALPQACAAPCIRFPCGNVQGVSLLLA
jgi:integrin-linked kinase-associated serine/threonine phosphatase 2C